MPSNIRGLQRRRWRLTCPPQPTFIPIRAPARVRPPDQRQPRSSAAGFGATVGLVASQCRRATSRGSGFTSTPPTGLPPAARTAFTLKPESSTNWSLGFGTCPAGLLESLDVQPTWYRREDQQCVAGLQPIRNCGLRSAMPLTGFHYILPSDLGCAGATRRLRDINARTRNSAACALSSLMRVRFSRIRITWRRRITDIDLLDQ